MNIQSAQTPIQRESIALTLTPEEQDLLLSTFSSLILVLDEMPESYRASSKYEIDFAEVFYKKLQFFCSKSGDACRHPVQSPDALGQDGTNTHPDNCVCMFCFEQVDAGQGGTNE